MKFSLLQPLLPKQAALALFLAFITSTPAFAETSYCQSVFTNIPPFLSIERTAILTGDFLGITPQHEGEKKFWWLILNYEVKNNMSGIYSSNRPILKKINPGQAYNLGSRFVVHEFEGRFAGRDGKSQYYVRSKIEFENQNSTWIDSPIWKPSFALLTINIQHPGNSKYKEIHRLTGEEALESIRNLLGRNP